MPGRLRATRAPAGEAGERPGLPKYSPKPGQPGGGLIDTLPLAILTSLRPSVPSVTSV